MKLVLISPYYSSQPSGANNRFKSIVVSSSKLLGENLYVMVPKGQEISSEHCKFTLIGIPFTGESLFSNRLLLCMWLNVAQIYFFLKGWKVITDFNPVSFIQYISSDQYQLIHDARVFTDFGRWSTVSKFLMKKAWKRLKRIVTVSYTSRNALVSKLGLEESSIVVSYNGCTPNNSSLAPSKKIEKDIDLIYVATYEKRKNHINLIKALKYIDKPMSVCFVGFDNGTKALIESTIANSNAIHSYRLLSDVDDDKLCDLYKRSKLLVYPSFYEGFGMPLIEAASFGCPIACSNLEVFKELLKDYPCYFEPGDPEDIARAITESFNTIIRDVKDFDMSVFNWDVITVRLLQDINMNFRS